MISIGCVRITYRVAGIPGHHWSNFEYHSRSEVAGRMLPGEPVGGKRKLLAYRVFETELTTCAIRGSYNVVSEIESAEGNPRSTVKALTHFGIHVISRAVGTIVNRKKKMITDNERPSIVFALIGVPLDGGYQRG